MPHISFRPRGLDSVCVSSPLPDFLFPVQVKDGVQNSWVEEDVWRMELYLSVGILALGLLSLLAVASLPSVSSSVNWREFSFVQVGPTGVGSARSHVADTESLLPHI